MVQAQTQIAGFRFPCSNRNAVNCFRGEGNIGEEQRISTRFGPNLLVTIFIRISAADHGMILHQAYRSTHQPKNRAPTMKVGVPMGIRHCVPEWDANKDQAIHTLEPLSDSLTVVPQPRKKDGGCLPLWVRKLGEIRAFCARRKGHRVQNGHIERNQLRRKTTGRQDI